MAVTTSSSRGVRVWLMRALRIAAVAALAPLPFILLFAVVDPPVTMVMLGRVGSRLAAGASPVWPEHRPVSRREMAPALRRAVLASEDDRFYLHHGIDFVEIDKALDRRKRGGTLRGASTLSLLSKERILDLYINLAEWGPNQFGAEAGARHHFRKSAAKLTREEAARMAAILPAPRRWSPRGSVATRRIPAILQRMQYAAPKTEPK